MCTRRGFSLVELLVVVTVILILIALLQPSLMRARKAAQQDVCKARLNQLYHGHHYYSLDHSGRYPHYNHWLWNGPQGGVPSARWVEYGQIWPYVRTADMYFCPMDNRKRDPGTLAIGNGTNGTDPIHSYVRVYEPHQLFRGANSSYLRPSLIKPGVFRKPAGSILSDLAYAAAPNGPDDVALIFEEAIGNTDLIGPDTSWAVLNDGYSFFTYIQDMSTWRHTDQTGHHLYWDGHVTAIDGKRWNDWPVNHDPYAEHCVFGVQLP